MRIMVLNSGYEQTTLIDAVFNYVWVERYETIGEFQIELPNTSSNRNLLKIDTILMIDQSDMPMVVETQIIKKTPNGVTLQVKGRDLVSWLELRDAPWDVSYTAQRVSDIAYNILVRTIRDGNSYDKLPLVVRNYATDGAKYDYETVAGDLYENAQGILSDNHCSLRVRRYQTTANGVTTYDLSLDVYSGQNRSIYYNDRDGSLVNTNRITSKKKLRNVATVAYKASNKEDAKTLYRQVYANGGSASKTGLDRRVLRVDGTSINPNDYPGTRLNTALDRLGRAKLGQQKMIDAITGEVPDYALAKYRKDYYLGDRVNFKADDKDTTQARVTEFTWTLDETGFRKFPTLDPIGDTTA